MASFCVTKIVVKLGRNTFEIVHLLNNLLYERQPYRKRRTVRPVLEEPKPSCFYIRYYGLVVNTKTRIFVSTANATQSVTVTYTESTSAIQESFFVLLEFQMAPPRRATPKNLEGDRDYCGQLHVQGWQGSRRRTRQARSRRIGCFVFANPSGISSTALAYGGQAPGPGRGNGISRDLCSNATPHWHAKTKAMNPVEIELRLLEPCSQIGNQETHGCVQNWKNGENGDMRE